MITTCSETYSVFREALNNKTDASSLKLILDLQYAVVTTKDKAMIIDVCDVVGDSRATFTMNIPTAATVYTHVRRQEDLQCSSCAVASYSEQRSDRHCGGEMISTPNQACAALKDYCRSMMRSLYHNLVQDCIANTPGRKHGEKFWNFVHQRCQRNPGHGSTMWTTGRLKEQKKAVAKQNRASREAAERGHLDAMKYDEQLHPADHSASAETTEDDNNNIEEDWLTIDDESSADDIPLQLLTTFGLDVVGDTMLHALLADSERISLKRQLGSWIEVKVDVAKQQVTCNCEDYNFHYLCVHQVTLEVLQFRRLPSSKCSKHSCGFWTCAS